MPKAVVGIAHRHATGAFPAKSFHGGEGYANEVLRRLGYAVRDIGDAGSDWTDSECATIVADYFEMLKAELLGRRYNKAEHNRRLRETVRRSTGSIEFKHSNISAVLVQMQQPYIRGYQPRGNFQLRLADAVADYLDRHPDLFTSEEMHAAFEPRAPLGLPMYLDGLFEDPPEAVLPMPQATPWLSRRGRRVDFAQHDARNRELGRLEEQFALQVEQRRLLEAGRDDLAQRVEWIAETHGDGIGFDVLSYDADTEAER